MTSRGLGSDYSCSTSDCEWEGGGHSCSRCMPTFQHQGATALSSLIRGADAHHAPIYPATALPAHLRPLAVCRAHLRPLDACRRSLARHRRQPQAVTFLRRAYGKSLVQVLIGSPQFGTFNVHPWLGASRYPRTSHRFNMECLHLVWK